MLSAFSLRRCFQVPIKDFADGKIIGYGLLLTLALIGKLMTGILVPNFNNAGKFRGLHLRDCLITGFSMVSTAAVVACGRVFRFSK